MLVPGSLLSLSSLVRCPHWAPAWSVWLMLSQRFPLRMKFEGLYTRRDGLQLNSRLLVRRVIIASTGKYLSPCQCFGTKYLFLALFIYDWLVLLPIEIEEIWCRKLSIVTILFVGTRYGTLINWIVTVVDQTIEGNEFVSNIILTL